MDKKHSVTGVFLRGLAMGTVDIVPGVSGGTIAFITGIYPRLVNGINQVREEVQNTIKSPKHLPKAIKNIDWKFFLPLALGIGIALFLLSGLMTYLLENYTTNTFAFFAGLILASAYLLYKTLKNHSVQNFTLLLLGVVVAYILSGVTTFSIAHSYPIIFISGAIAICAMLLPGISGALLLVLLGQYEFVISAIHERALSIIFVFGLGALLGLAIFSKLVSFLLKKYKTGTLFFLTGLMLGALRVPYLAVTNSVSIPYVYIAYFMVFGFGVVIGVEYLAKFIQYRKSK